MNKVTDFPVKKKPGRPKGSKTTPKIGDKVSFNKLNDMANDKEIDRLKNLIARQDDLISQLEDDLRNEKNTCAVLREECDHYDEKIESYREILKTLLEISE